MKKKLTLLCLGLLLGVLTVMAQETIHVVKRGETLTMIATQYGVSVDALKEANPLAGKTLFVGMKLQIPAIPQEAIQPQVAPIQDEQAAEPKELAQESYVSTKNEKHRRETTSFNDKLSFAVYGGLSINSWVGDYCDTKVESPNTDKYKSLYGFHVGLRTSYNFYKGLFAELGLQCSTKGYKRDQYLTSGSSWDDDGANYEITRKTTFKTYTLDVPLYVGYEHEFASTNSILFKVGPYMAFTLSGESKTSAEEIFMDTIHSSEVDRYTDKTDVKDYPNYNDMIFGLSAAVEYKFGNMFVGFTYQRGLSEQIKKLEKKPYEQSMLISVGFLF